MKKRIFLLLTCLFLPLAKPSAQVMPRAGTHFTFAIPEGADALVDTIQGSNGTVLFLNIVSHYAGEGSIVSPSGFCQDFSFLADSVMTVILPHSLMLYREIGKSNKGIIIKTTQPANVVFHDFLDAAGEATQILPDEALDTGYHVTTWGIANDPPFNFGNENNHSQFVVTASQDGTDVTIVPSVDALGGHRAGVPITVNLGRGECYIVKSDINALPADLALTHSMIHSSKPVSVLSAVTCAYVPLIAQSCNEVLDELVPRRIKDTIFYVCPLRDTLVANIVMLTSDTLDFFAFLSNGFTYHTTTGSIGLQITKPEMIKVTAPSQCFLLSEGSNVQEIGDPSMVSILPESQYIDTMLWYTPPFSSIYAPFQNYCAVVYPKSAEASVLLDGVPIKNLARPRNFIGTQMGAAVARINPGVHTITSPVPVFATASGFSVADSYSFIPGSVAPQIPADTTPVALDISSTPATICHNFDVAVTSTIKSENAITKAVLTVIYDANILTVVTAQPGPTAQGAQWVTDSRTLGVITFRASCMKPFSATGPLALLTFSCGTVPKNTSISADLKLSGGETQFSRRSGTALHNISIAEVRDTVKAIFSISVAKAQFGDLVTANIQLLSAPNQVISAIHLFVAYNHDMLSLLRADLSNSIIPGNLTIKPTLVDAQTDELLIDLMPPIALSSTGLIAKLIFESFITDSTSGNIGLRAVLENSRPCPLDILSDQVSSKFTGSDTCGFAEIRSGIRRQPFTINSVVPNPSKGSFTIDIDRHLSGAPLHISLIDMLGNEVWSADHSSSSAINEKISCAIPIRLSAGTYFLRVAIPEKTQTQKLIIRN